VVHQGVKQATVRATAAGVSKRVQPGTAVGGGAAAAAAVAAAAAAQQPRQPAAKRAAPDMNQLFKAASGALPRPVAPRPAMARQSTFDITAVEFEVRSQPR
jgi:hypothetical protein